MWRLGGALGGLRGFWPSGTNFKNPLLVMGRHEGANPLFSDEQILHRQFVDGLSNRALADLITCGQLCLTWNRLGRTPLTRLQALQDQGFDLLVKRAKGGDGLGLCGQQLPELGGRSCRQVVFWLGLLRQVVSHGLAPIALAGHGLQLAVGAGVRVGVDGHGQRWDKIEFSLAPLG